MSNSVVRGGYMLVQAETGPKCRALEEGEELSYSLFNKHLV